MVGNASDILTTFVVGTECIVQRNTALGVTGFDLRIDAADGIRLWNAILDVGRAVGMQPMGHVAYELLRVETGTPVYGMDIDHTNLPQEVGRPELTISFTKGCYIGQETVARINSYGHVNRHLVGLSIPELEEPPAHGSKVVSEDKVVGQITSAVYSPTIGGVIALGYVRSKRGAAGTILGVECGNRTLPAEVRSLPLVAHTR